MLPVAIYMTGSANTILMHIKVEAQLSSIFESNQSLIGLVVFQLMVNKCLAYCHLQYALRNKGIK